VEAHRWQDDGGKAAPEGVSWAILRLRPEGGWGETLSSRFRTGS